MEEEEEEDERSTAGVAARGSPDLRGGADEHFRRMLVARQRRRHGMFTTALHYGMRLADDQLFRVSLAVPTHEGGVHTVFKDDDDVDSDDDMDLDRLFRGNGGRSNGRSSFRPTDERERKSGRETASHSPRRKPATHFRFMMYNNGRVAWWPQAYARPYSAVVDDLRTGVRRMYDFPAHGLRQTGYTAAMSSELLLMGRGCVLHAWHLRLDRLQTATFPRAIERVFVEADRVVAVARNSDVFYWRYGEEEEEAGCCWRALDMGDDDVDDYGGRGLGGCFARGRVRMSGLVELPPTSPPHRMGLRLCEDGMLLDFILHPVVMDTLFVVTFSTDHRLCVHEIRDVGRGGRRFATYQPQSDDMTVFEDLSEHGYLRWEKIDSHGGYCLMMVNGEETRWARHRDGGHNLAHAHEQGHDHEDDSAQPGSPCAQPDAAYTVVAICFNIYTREFDFVVYHPPWHFATSWHLWNGLLFTPDGKTGRDLVIASRRCSHHSTTHTYSSDEDTSSARGPEGPRIPTYYTTTEETQVNSRDHATSHPKEDRPVFARRRRFAMSHADQQSILADSQLPGAASVIEHIAHTYSPSEPLPGITGLPDRSTGGSRENVPLQHRKQRILGDDGLLVFVDDQDYTVWGFGLDLVAEKGNDGIHDGASGRGRGGRGKGKGNQSRSASMARILPWIKK
ncbi:uncharacterized protein B0I36DRAFT_324242 [Microdochium trichocladiopsis]|uniref:F-box domain-containing protein n=1 Tax=Microdochium trichocladiopsis TaxID=1682393 RepID=A0A9P8Y776_9PEZI|nr:uncharacterized protein B0I36DRAFT_324242 [Microdochium trichocladiopsis]KAH7031586.1 hypothetical protein B0I36DRAFT_324242 [Microdochium trichocladiopsis]